MCRHAAIAILGVDGIEGAILGRAFMYARCRALLLNAVSQLSGPGREDRNNRFQMLAITLPSPDSPAVDGFGDLGVARRRNQAAGPCGLTMVQHFVTPIEF